MKNLVNSGSRILTTIAVVCGLFAVAWLNAGDINPPPGPIRSSGPSLSDLAASIDQLRPAGPAELVELGGSVVSPGNSRTMVQINSNGSNIGTFTVPSGKNFVLTDLTAHPEVFNDASINIRINQNTTARKSFRFRADQVFQLHLRSGMLFASGATLAIDNLTPAGGGSVRTFITGYLVDAP